MRLGERLWKLPWATFAWMLWRMARLVGGLQRAADESKDRVLRGAPGGAERAERRKETPGSGERIAGPQRKEEDEMSDWNGDDQVRLFEYTLVTIRRDDERILAHGQRLITDPMTEDEFSAWVIADYTRNCPDLPSQDYQYLRVATRFLGKWNRQPLHYESRQLRALEEISAKLGPPVPYTERRDDGPRGRSVDQVAEC